MPRPRVQDGQRQRVLEACSFCRDSKKKCSGIAPCTQCSRRGQPEQCHMTGASRRSRASKSQAVTIDAQNAGGATLPSPSDVTGSLRDNEGFGAAHTAVPLSPSASQDSYGAFQSTANGNTGEHDSSLASPGSRMLISAHGERVYIGAAAPIAFLQTVRRVVAGQIGPSGFSHSENNETMLEIETQQSMEDTTTITQEQKSQFLQCYLSVTEAFVDIFDHAELEVYVMSSGTGSFLTATGRNDASNQIEFNTERPSPLRRATLDLVLAIGAQCTSKQETQSVGRSLFREAQRQALSEMIQDPDLEMVRAYLLMAFYMLGECRRNTAYMYLSVAVRAAIALGLHSRSSYSSELPFDANDKLRLRIWMTCRVGDKLVNSLLGRPAATIGIPEELDSIFTNLVSSSDQSLKRMVVAYRIVTIIDEINTKLYGGQDIQLAAVERLLQSIEIWKRDSFSLLQQTPLGSSTLPTNTFKEGKEGLIGVLHLSCLYYFAVMLATRPSFISALPPQGVLVDQRSPMSEACLDSAMYLAQTCVEALEADILESNMCILKALIFAAGLVLGVESFAKSGNNKEIEHAFDGAKRVLGLLATRSPQARHYLDILSSLSAAITKQQSRMEPNKSNRYVSRLFSFASSGAGGDALGERIPEETSGMDVFAGGPNAFAIDDLLGTPSRWSGNDQIDQQMFLDWETVNIGNWDNFPFSI